MNSARPYAAKRVLVTGSRGKSSIVRLVHAALCGSGHNAFARITGVIPRELGPDSSRTILRSSGAHVEEMRWWLKRLPLSAQGVVLENSAITPELQGLAGRWLRPQVTVLTNVFADHQEIWGPTGACAKEVLLSGIPNGCKVAIPFNLKGDGLLRDVLDSRKCPIVVADALPGDAGYQASNMALAQAVVRSLGLDKHSATRAMRSLKPDQYDFQVAHSKGAEVAMAFTANDIKSTRALFGTLGWKEEETRIVYNHRSDRSARLKSFAAWMGDPKWRDVLIIGDKPGIRMGSVPYLKIKSAVSLLRIIDPGDRVFGCGNVAGLPLELATLLGR